MNDKRRKAKPQIEKFQKAAREHEADSSEMEFDERLKRIAKSPPPKERDKRDDG